MSVEIASFGIATVEPFLYRVPIETPVVTSFGVMRDRPALFVRVALDDGAEGWGEVWCNFPSVGAEHRARLIDATLAPLVVGRRFADPADPWRLLTAATEVLAIQSGEPGPLGQAIAGIDLAVWDAIARRAGAPLHAFLREVRPAECRGTAAARVPAYASGLNPDAPEVLAERQHAAGYRRFKLKVGFGRERDIANLSRLRETFSPGTELMVDANQAWDLPTAREMAEALAPLGPVWLEEPVRADTPLSDWVALAKGSPIPLAAGENLRGGEFAAMVEAGAVRFLQPDLGKWGGLSMGVPVAAHALANGVALCPHWLGGGVGLVASLHFLAAVGGPGWLEVDSNPNPLRDVYVDGFPRVEAGDMILPPSPGVGVAPDRAALERYRVVV